MAVFIFYTAYSERLYQSHADELRLMRDNRVQHLRSWVAEKKANFQYWHGILFSDLRDGTWTGAETRDIQQHMEAFCRAHTDMRGLILIDASTGKILQSTVNGLAAGMDGSTQPEFNAVRKTRAFSVSNIHVGPVLRELSFSVTQPYFKNDNPESELWAVLIMRIALGQEKIPMLYRVSIIKVLVCWVLICICLS